MTSLRERMTEDMRLRNLALNTQLDYIRQVSLFARYFKKSPELLGPSHIREYQVYMVQEKHLAPGSIQNAVAALRFQYGLPSGHLAFLHPRPAACGRGCRKTGQRTTSRFRQSAGAVEPSAGSIQAV